MADVSDEQIRRQIGAIMSMSDEIDGDLMLKCLTELQARRAALKESHHMTEPVTAPTRRDVQETAMSDVKLEPCPFCNGAPTLHENDWCEPSEWSVQCVACNASSYGETDQAEAIAAWNRRPTPAPSQSFNEGLEEAARIAHHMADQGTSGESIATAIRARKKT